MKPAAMVLWVTIPAQVVFSMLCAASSASCALVDAAIGEEIIAGESPTWAAVDSNCQWFVAYAPLWQRASEAPVSDFATLVNVSDEVLRLGVVDVEVNGGELITLQSSLSGFNLPAQSAIGKSTQSWVTERVFNLAPTISLLDVQPHEGAQDLTIEIDAGQGEATLWMDILPGIEDEFYGEQYACGSL